MSWVFFSLISCSFICVLGVRSCKHAAVRNVRGSSTWQPGQTSRSPSSSYRHPFGMSRIAAGSPEGPLKCCIFKSSMQRDLGTPSEPRTAAAKGCLALVGHGDTLGCTRDHAFGCGDASRAGAKAGRRGWFLAMAAGTCEGGGKGVATLATCPAHVHWEAANCWSRRPQVGAKAGERGTASVASE